MGARTRVRRRSAERRWIGLWLLALFFVGEALVGAHHTLVEHHVCEAHGELTHGERHLDHHDLGGHHGHHGHHAHPEASTHRAAAAPRSSEEPAFAPDASGSEHGEHCTFPKSRDERKLLATGPATRVTLGECGSAPPELVSQARFAGIPLFRLAPKQSPPAMA